MLTFSQYQSVLRDLCKAGIQSRTIRSLHEQGPLKGEIFIKHDVEARVDRALKLAEIEALEGHQATYYFQGELLCREATQACIQKICCLGHEVALHYDVLDANEGNFKSAIQQFRHFLADLEQQSCPVQTVCPHGNPTKLRSGWLSNKDFFRNSDVRREFPGIIDIVVDFKLIFKDGTYLSDAGFNLRKIQNIDTNDESNASAMNDGLEIYWDQVIDEVRSGQGLVLSVHPHRIEESKARLYLSKLVFISLRKIYKKTKNIVVVRQLADRFYSYTRRF